MSDKYEGMNIAFGLGLIVGLALMMIVLITTLNSSDKHWQLECVKHNAAEYNTTTGVWQWKTPSPGEKGGE